MRALLIALMAFSVAFSAHADRVDDLLVKISSENKSIRTDALFDLGRIEGIEKDERVVKPLVKLLKKSDDFSTRKYSAELLVRHMNEEAYTSVIEAAYKEGHESQKIAANALAWSDRKSFDLNGESIGREKVLMKLTESGNSIVRRDAVMGLGRSYKKNEAIYEFLKPILLEDKDEFVREKAAEAIAKSELADAIPYLVSQVVSPSKKTYAAGAAILNALAYAEDIRSIPAIKIGLKSEDVKMREQAALAATKYSEKDESLIEELIEAHGVERGRYIKEKLVEAIMLSKSPKGIAIAKLELLDGRKWPRKDAIRYLGQFVANDTSILKDLIKTFESEKDDEVKKDALIAMLNSSDLAVLPFAKIAINSDDANVRKAGLAALARIANKESIVSMARLLGDNNEEIRGEAFAHLKALLKDRVSEEQMKKMQKCFPGEEHVEYSERGQAWALLFDVVFGTIVVGAPMTQAAMKGRYRLEKLDDEMINALQELLKELPDTRLADTGNSNQ